MFEGRVERTLTSTLLVRWHSGVEVSWRDKIAQQNSQDMVVAQRLRASQEVKDWAWQQRV